jgi:integrase
MWLQRLERESGIRWRVYWRDPAGKVHGKVFERRRDAEAYGRLMEQWKREGTYFDPARGKITLAQFVESEMLGRADLSEKTRDNYGGVWRRHIQEALGERRLDAITRADIKQLIADLESRGTGSAAIEMAARFLSSTLSRAVDAERIVRNPARGLRLSRSRAREPRFLSDEEVVRLADAVPERYRAMILVLAYGGIRLGEAVALRIGDVDLMRRRVMVVRSAVDVRGRRVEKETKTGRRRAIVVPATVADELATHVARYSRPLDPLALVFTSKLGGPLQPSNFRNRVFRPATVAAALEPAPTVHDLRHTAVALGILRGAGVKQIQEQLGHSSVTVTLDRYGHLFDVLHEDLAQRHEVAIREAIAKSTPRAPGRGRPPLATTASSAPVR